MQVNRTTLEQKLINNMDKSLSKKTYGDLPEDILINIFTFLPGEDICSFELISKHHYKVLHENIPKDTYWDFVAKKFNTNIENLLSKIEAVKTYSICHFVSVRLGFSRFVTIPTQQPIQQLNMEILELQKDKSIVLGFDNKSQSYYIEVHGTGMYMTDRINFAYRLFQKKDSKLWGLTQRILFDQGHSSYRTSYPKDDQKEQDPAKLDQDTAEEYFHYVFTGNLNKNFPLFEEKISRWGQCFFNRDKRKKIISFN